MQVTVKTVKVSKKCQIAVPKHARQILNIKPGDRLLVEVRDDRIIMIPEPKDYVKHLSGLHREVWEAVDPKEYLKGERAAWNQGSK